MSRARMLMTILGAILVALGVSFFSVNDPSLERVRKGGVLRIGYAVEAPHAFLTSAGDVSGQSPEVARCIAERLGIPRIEWRLVDFGALLDELREGRIDMVAAGMFITPERARLASFSDPIFHVRPGLLVARGNPHALHSFADVLAGNSVRVAVLSGAVEADVLRQAGLKAARLVMVPDAQTGRVAVEAGLADALALSSPTIQWMALGQELGKTEQARPFDLPGPEFDRCSGYGAFVFRKEDKALLAAWNREQKGFIASEEFRDLMESFGFGPDEMPGNVTTKEILAR